MKGKLTLIVAAVLGAMFGALVMLSIPTSGTVPPPAASPPSAALASPTKASIPTLLAWTPGGLPEGLEDSARRILGVDSVAVVRSGVAWLDSWSRRPGTEVAPPEGMMVPVEVAAVDSREYSSFVPPYERARFAELEQGPLALLGKTGARLRGIEAQGSLRFGGFSLDVSGVVEDELIGAHEAVVSTVTGARLGITKPRYLLITLAPGASRTLVEEELKGAVPPGTRVRVRAPGETPVFRHGDAVLAMSQVKDLFGEFAARPGLGGSIEIDPAWVERNISSTGVPLLGQVSCHRSVIPQIAAAMEEVARRGLDRLVDASDVGGCFSARFLNDNPQAGLSHHAWGIAIDLNVSENPFGREPSMDRRVVEILERWGLAWGGRWLVPDGMHFEFLRWPLSPKG